MFPKAILHVDGDAFFASCEITKRPWLKGKPVVTGLEKGIASSMTYEAKARGITRAMRISEIKKVCPEVVILPSDYLLYATYARRMYTIVRRYTDIVEEYSIDECFADLTGMDKLYGLSYEEIAMCIKRDLETELGITFSVGLSVNKVLAKLASKYKKPAGFTVITKDKISEYISVTPVHKLWGIGGQTSLDMGIKGIKMALDLANKSHEYIRSNFDKPVQEMWAELNGYYINKVDANDTEHSSIQRTRTFHPVSKDINFLISQLSIHAEHACATLRKRDQRAGRFSFFLKTQEFRYLSLDFKLMEPSSTPNTFVDIIESSIQKIFVKGIEYRACGVRLFDLTDGNQNTFDLFNEKIRDDSFKDIFDVVDDISHRYGSEILHLASSKSVNRSKRELSIPFLGSVR